MDSGWGGRKLQNTPVIESLNLQPGFEMTDKLYYEKEIRVNHFVKFQFMEVYFFIWLLHAFYKKNQYFQMCHPQLSGSHNSFHGSRSDILCHHNLASLIHARIEKDPTSIAFVTIHCLRFGLNIFLACWRQEYQSFCCCRVIFARWCSAAWWCGLLFVAQCSQLFLCW